MDKKVKDLTIADILSSDIYQKKLQDRLDYMKQRATIVKTPFVMLMLDKGMLEMENMLNEYMLIINKKSNLSSTERGWIYNICSNIFSDVMRKLIEDEKEEDSNNGND